METSEELEEFRNEVTTGVSDGLTMADVNEICEQET